MSDLAEHIGTIFWILGGLLGILGVLIALIWRDLRGNLAEIKKEAGKFAAWLIEQTNKGGVVTRDDHFIWCDEYRGKCPALLSSDAINLWKNAMLERGGVVTWKEHNPFCEHMIEMVIKRMDESFAHNRELLNKQLETLQATMEGKILKEILSMKKEMMEKK